MDVLSLLKKEMIMREMIIKGFEAGRKLTQDNFEKEDWDDLEKLLTDYGFEL